MERRFQARLDELLDDAEDPHQVGQTWVCVKHASAMQSIISLGRNDLRQPPLVAPSRATIPFVRLVL